MGTLRDSPRNGIRASRRGWDGCGQDHLAGAPGLCRGFEAVEESLLSSGEVAVAD